MAVIHDAWRDKKASNARSVQTPAIACTEEDRAFAVAFEQLTPRRQQVLRLLAEGISQQEVADRLFIQRHTVKTTLTLVYAWLKIGTPNHDARACYLLGRYDAQRQRREVSNG